MIETEIIEDVQRLQAFRPEWSDFVDRSAAATPFQTPEWLFTWWSNFGSGVLRVIVFRAQRRVAGVLPAFLHHWNDQRQITLIGSGITDYLDPLLDPLHVPEILDTLRSNLRSWSDWDR